MTAQQGELAPNLSEIAVGTQAATISLPGPLMRKRCTLKSVQIIDQAGVVADDTDYLIITLQIGNTVLATYDTRAANQADLTALVAGQAVIASSNIPAGSQLKLVVTSPGVAATTLMQVYLEFWPN